MFFPLCCFLVFCHLPIPCYCSLVLVRFFSSQLRPKKEAAANVTVVKCCTLCVCYCFIYVTLLGDQIFLPYFVFLSIEGNSNIFTIIGFSFSYVFMIIKCYGFQTPTNYKSIFSFLNFASNQINCIN